MYELACGPVNWPDQGHRIRIAFVLLESSREYDQTWVTMTSAKAGRVSWRRRLLSIAGRLGLKSIDAGPGAALVMRTGDNSGEVIRLNDDLVLVAAGKAAKYVRPTKLDRGTWLVSTKRLRKEERKEAAAITGIDWLKLDTPESHLRAEHRITKKLGVKHITWTLDRFGIDVVIDGGANVGQYAKKLRAEGYTGHIISFEPVPSYFDKLKNEAANDDKWTVHQMALGAEDGSVPMHVQRVYSSLLESTEFGRSYSKSMNEFSGDEPIEVPVRRLDGVWDNILDPLYKRGITNPRTYLKLDTQGFDLEAFAGLGERSRDVVAMQSEVNLIPIYENMPRMPEAIATYEADGFEISGLYPVIRNRDGRVIEYDCVMIRPDELPE